MTEKEEYQKDKREDEERLQRLADKEQIEYQEEQRGDEERLLDN